MASLIPNLLYPSQDVRHVISKRKSMEHIIMQPPIYDVLTSTQNLRVGGRRVVRVMKVESVEDKVEVTGL